MDCKKKTQNLWIDFSGQGHTKHFIQGPSPILTTDLLSLIMKISG